MNFKLGKRPVDRTHRFIALSDHMDKAATWPAVPAWGWEYSFDATTNGLLDALGNDLVGDCVIATAHHYAVADTAAAGNPLRASAALCLQDYSSITGYDPSQTDPATGQNPTDNGTTFAQLLSYWQRTGMTLLDANGKEVKHRIVGSAALDLASIGQQRYAAYTFGGNLMGIQCPQNFLNETSNWVYDPTSPVVGGHGVPILGEGSVGWHTDSWGILIPAPWHTSQMVADEMYIVVTAYWLDRQGKSPTGLDLDGLVAAMKAL